MIRVRGQKMSCSNKKESLVSTMEMAAIVGSLGPNPLSYPSDVLILSLPLLLGVVIVCVGRQCIAYYSERHATFVHYRHLYRFLHHYEVMDPESTENENRAPYCTICLETIEWRSTSRIVQLPCQCRSRTYHFGCLYHWFLYNPQCPLCRQPFLLDDLPKYR